MQGMGMIDEGYESNRCQNGQSSTQITNLKSQSMISSPVEGQSIQASSENGEGSFSRLRYESKRLSTFDKWPASAKVEPRKIAKAGFFYTGQYAEAKCLWCGCVITTWEYGDQVMTRHRSASPDCPFVRDISDNIPLLNSTASSTNIVNSHSEGPYIHLESRNDSVDHGHHHGQNTNSGMASPDPAAETTDEIQIAPMMVDEIEINVNEMETSSPVGGHLGASNLNNGFQSQPYITSSSSRTGSELQSGSGSGELRHPVSGRRLSGDPMNRPTVVSPDLDDNIYKIEAERLRTFEAWPLSFIRPADLANAGFVYTGRGDCVRCVFCREHVGDWDEEDFPHTEHRSLFPHCPFVRGLDVGNVATIAGIREHFGMQEDLHSRSPNNRRSLTLIPVPYGSASSGGDELSTDVTPNSTQEQRLRQSPNIIQPHTDSIGNTRLRPHSGQNVRSYRRQQSEQISSVSNQRPRSTSYDHHPLLDRNFMDFLGQPPHRTITSGDSMLEEGNDEAGIRPRRSGGPEKGVVHFLNPERTNRKDGGPDRKHSGASSTGSQSENVGIIRHSGPANPKYSTVEARARTFREWPPALKQQPTQLSEAGFFYIGLSDQVKCFYCDGGLRNWQPEDDPWTEHARWFSECGFVRLVKGDDFISKCLNTHPPEAVQGFPVVSRDRSRNAVREDDLQQMMASPLVHQVLSMGISSTRIKKALKQRLQETGSGFKFANELVVAALTQPEVLRGAEDQQGTSDNNQTNIYGSLAAQNPFIPSLQQVPTSESQISTSTVENINPSSNPLNHPASSAACKQQVISNQIQNTALIALPAASAAGTLESTNQNAITSTNFGDPNGPCLQLPEAEQRVAKDQNSLEKSVDLEIENRRLKDQRTCKICMDREIGVVFLPCGHLISCVQCAPALKDCPLCRQPIHGTVKTYMS